MDDKAVQSDVDVSDGLNRTNAVLVVRIIDVALALVALILIVPILVLIAIILRIADGQPILFKQQRSGLNERAFEILKFRTLRPMPDGGLSSTPFGQFLRTTSLDELPQLFNILRGEMSFVGPRPLLPDYSPYFSQEERLRFVVRPGLTGLAQISGGNVLSWDDKLESDVRFVKEYSVRAYLRILIATPSAVIRRHGAAKTWNEEIRLDDERRLK